jgi:hypothetical protein
MNIFGHKWQGKGGLFAERALNLPGYTNGHFEDVPLGLRQKENREL